MIDNAHCEESNIKRRKTQREIKLSRGENNSNFERKRMFNNILNKEMWVHNNEIELYEKLGWKTGILIDSKLKSNSGRKWMNKNNQDIFVKKNEIEDYLENGWLFGRLGNGHVFISEEQIEKIKTMLKNNMMYNEIAEKMNISSKLVSSYAKKYNQL